MPSPFGQTGYRHEDYQLKRELERIGKRQGASQTVKETVSSPGTSITPTTKANTPVSYSYNAYWEFVDNYVDDTSLELDCNRNKFGGWIPVSANNLVINDKELWGNWIDNHPYSMPLPFDPSSLMIRTKDLFYFYPSKAGVYTITVKIYLDVWHIRSGNTQVDSIPNAILIACKDTYSNLFAGAYYNPKKYNNIIAPIDHQVCYAILDSRWRYNRDLLDTADEDTFRLLAKKKILLTGTTNMRLDPGDVATFWYKFDTNHAWTSGGIWQNLLSPLNAIGVERIAERINIEWSGEDSYDSGNRPNSDLEDIIDNYN